MNSTGETRPPDKLRVGILLSSLGLMPGGLETIAFEFGRGLAERGHEVTFITGGIPTLSSPKDFQTPLVRHIRVPCIPSNLFFWRPFVRFRRGLPLFVQSSTFAASCRLSRQTRQLIPQLDVTLTFLEVETAFISRWRSLRFQPHVSYFSGGISEKWMHKNQSTSTIAISETIAQRYREQHGLRIDGIVTPGVTEEWFKAKILVRQQPHSLLYVGRLEANKGIVELIEIFKELAQEYPLLILRLIGHGPLREWIHNTANEAKLADRIQCMGPLHAVEIQQMLRDADVFVFPSHYESFGIAVLEALASGVPTVCSDIPALREVCGNAAIQLPPNNIAAWLTPLRSLLANHNLREQLAIAGREQAKKFSWKNKMVTLEKYLYQAVEISSAERAV